MNANTATATSLLARALDALIKGDTSTADALMTEARALRSPSEPMPPTTRAPMPLSNAELTAADLDVNIARRLLADAVKHRSDLLCVEREKRGPGPFRADDGTIVYIIRRKNATGDICFLREARGVSE